MWAHRLSIYRAAIPYEIEDNENVSILTIIALSLTGPLGEALSKGGPEGPNEKEVGEINF